MKRICFVVQRYGPEVNGGAELECRQYAEHLSGKYDVEVVTTCAIDYMTWKNEYKPGAQILNGVTVRRFPVVRERNPNGFALLSGLVYHLRCPVFVQEQWMRAQGPYSVELLKYIKNSREKYDVFFFMTYLYCSTYFGIRQVPEKSVLIPTAHDERPIYLSIFRQTFASAKAFFFNTPEEKAFVDRIFNTSSKPFEIGGIGIDVPENIDGTEFRKRFGLAAPYIVYVGRVDESKGCGQLVKYFLRYKKESHCRHKLVLVGKAVMDIPDDDDIVSLGYVDDADKFAAVRESEFLVLPSQFESLSIAVLEAMSLYKPVLVNGACEVLKGHCEKGNCGLCYTTYDEFKKCLDFMIENKEYCNELGSNGNRYQKQNYDWSIILGKLDHIIESAVGN